MSKESRRQRQRESRAARKATKAAGLNLVVATSPARTEEGRFLAHDLELVRASLLYADTVELLSPAALLVGSAAALHESGPDVWLDVLETFDDDALARYTDDDPQQFRETLRAFRALQSLPRAERRKGLGVQGSTKLASLLADFQSSMNAAGGPRESMQGLLQRAQVPELEVALEAGVLSLSTDFMSLDADTDTQIREYTDRLKELLGRPGSHLLLDERMSSIAQGLIDDGDVNPSTASLTRVVRAKVGTGLVSHLPAFPDASIESILETRQDLADPLARYRRGVKNLSRTVEAEPLSAELGAEVEDMWRDEVVPAVNDLRHDLSMTRLAHDTAVNLGRDTTSMLLGSGFFFGVNAVTDLSSLLAAGVAAAPVVGKAVADAYGGLAGDRREAQRHDLFYLLALEDRLSP